MAGGRKRGGNWNRYETPSCAILLSYIQTGSVIYGHALLLPQKWWDLIALGSFTGTFSPFYEPLFALLLFLGFSARDRSCPELPSRSTAKLWINAKFPALKAFPPKEGAEPKGCTYPQCPAGTPLPEGYGYSSVPEAARMGKGTLGAGEVSDACAGTEQTSEFIKCSSDLLIHLGRVQNKREDFCCFILNTLSGSKLFF